MVGKDRGRRGTSLTDCLGNMSDDIIQLLIVEFFMENKNGS